MGHKSQLQAQVTRQHHTDLAEKIMPLLAPFFPPGFEPHSSVIVPEVFEQMRLYMNCSDPDERSIREAKMKKTLNELSQDPVAQRSCLRLEAAPKIVTVPSPVKGRVFDFSKVQEKQSTDVAESSSRSSANQSSRSERDRAITPSQRILFGETDITADKDMRNASDKHPQQNITVPTANNLVGVREGTQVEAGVFVIGSGDNIGDRSNKSRNSYRSRSTWSRKNQNNRNKSASRHESDIHEREDGTGKRKADEDGEVSSKIALARNCRLKEIPSSGNRLSWGGVREVLTNGLKEKVWVQCRLDRAFGNAEWFSLFPQAHTLYLDKTGSDHRPIFTSLANSGQRRTGRFTFDKRWCKKPEIATVIKRGWCDKFDAAQGSVSERIKACRQELCKWKRHANVNSSVNIRNLRRKLEVEESKRFPNLAILPSLRVELEKAYDEEESYWKQKSKNTWLKVGDKNTKVFHGWVESRRMKNKMRWEI
ncbi:Endonuclease/exonuclease/phosphatase protein [Raphanus sativus]|nr:Endonuclease/exonuclease/phosphatase protein [Raphanus sativus]